MLLTALPLASMAALAGAEAEQFAASAPAPAAEAIAEAEAPTQSMETPPPVTEAEAPLSEADEALIDGRRRPGYIKNLPDKVTQSNIGAVGAPPPQAFPTDQIPIPDRWRLVETLGIVKERWWDPYHQNTLKGDRPVKGEDWFLALGGLSDTVIEPRSFPVPANRQIQANPDTVDVFGRDKSLVASQTFLVSASYIKGSTAYKPPEIEYRVALAFNMNYVDVQEKRVLFVQPSKGTDRFDKFVGVQELFVDRHLRNVSDRYDFDSVRIGIQPFQADFRGFLFNDNQLGIRFFGNRDDNRYQYNLAGFWRLEKDTNSGLNDVTKSPRDDYILFANLYAQDLPIPGLTTQFSATLHVNRERNDVHIDDNGFPVRPVLLGNLRGRDQTIVYLGVANDGHIGRINLTSQFYAALGRDSNNLFTGVKSKVRAFFAAAEASYDIDWVRLRASGLYASGDSDPYDSKEGGFDAIFENPIFAGADTSYWIRQTIPFAGGGRVVSINGRNGILNSLRSSKEQGQSNFNNPGTMLLGAGADFDITSKFRLSLNANHLWFENTKTLQVLRNEGTIPKSIGWDLSAAAIWRPEMIQNVVFRLSAAVLKPGGGFRDLFAQGTGNNRHYSLLFNTILSY